MTSGRTLELRRSGADATVTLSTTGYGHTAPVSDPARMMVSLEIVGCW